MSALIDSSIAVAVILQFIEVLPLFVKSLLDDFLRQLQISAGETRERFVASFHAAFGFQRMLCLFPHLQKLYEQISYIFFYVTWGSL